LVLPLVLALAAAIKLSMEPTMDRTGRRLAVLLMMDSLRARLAEKLVEEATLRIWRSIIRPEVGEAASEETVRREAVWGEAVWGDAGWKTC
jgi:hypothetical protein